MWSYRHIPDLTLVCSCYKTVLQIPGTDTIGTDRTKSRSIRKYSIRKRTACVSNLTVSFLGSQSSIPHVHVKFGLKACKANRCGAASTPARVPATPAPLPVGLPDSTYDNSHRLLPRPLALAHCYREFIWLLLYQEKMGDPMWSKCLLPSDMFVWPSTPRLAKVVPLVNSVMELHSIQCSLSLEYIFLSISRHSSHCPENSFHKGRCVMWGGDRCYIVGTIPPILCLVFSFFLSQGWAGEIGAQQTLFAVISF